MTDIVKQCVKEELKQHGFHCYLAQKKIRIIIFLKKKIIFTKNFEIMASADSSLDIVPTKALLLKNKNAREQFKTVVFESHKSKKNLGGKVAQQRKHNGKGDDDDEFDMKKARNEVFNFGISGYGFEDQQKAKVALAIKLGAKPQKNPYKNYKELIEERKEAKKKAAEEEYIRTVGKNSNGVATVSCSKINNPFAMKKKKKSNGIGALDQHYGVVNPKIHNKKKKK